MSDRVILWDFDGTLAYREGLWSGCFAEVLGEVAPDLGLTPDDVRPLLQNGFPWHRPDHPHLDLCETEAWWAPIEDLLAGVAGSLGVPADRVRECAHETRLRYIDGTGFRLFGDVVPVLSSLRHGGWDHVILSNHVPELEAIVETLQLRPLVSEVFTSAVTGYEKPHPESFRLAREACGDPSEIWMIGDNPWADVLGAEEQGIPAILVREEHPEATRRANDLHGVARYLT